MEKINIRFIVLLCFTIISGTETMSAQSFNSDKTAFSNFLKRMYVASPFEGVKIVDDYDHQYLVSILSLKKDKYNNESIMFRVAQVKAQSQASTFINGASVSMDMIITTKETKDANDKVTSIVEKVEKIKQNSMGFSQGLELLTNFESDDDLKKVFIYMRKLNNE